MNSKMLPKEPDYVAPDGSLIRLLVTGTRGGLAHCVLPPNSVTSPVRHRQVQELWYVLGGTGQLWRRAGDVEKVVDLKPGLSITIEPECPFQFRSSGEELQLLLATLPPWPGKDEAIPSDGPWPPSVKT
jgi:mannose-6-phosphate isomerase-like protein (cupin superfamily)